VKRAPTGGVKGSEGHAIDRFHYLGSNGEIDQNGKYVDTRRWRPNLGPASVVETEQHYGFHDNRTDNTKDTTIINDLKLDWQIDLGFGLVTIKRTVELADRKDGDGGKDWIYTITRTSINRTDTLKVVLGPQQKDNPPVEIPSVPPSIADQTPPTITAWSVVVRRRRIVRVTISFSEPLDEAAARMPTNYRIVLLGRDGKAGTRDDRVLRLRSASYDPATMQSTLVLRRPVPRGRAIGALLPRTSQLADLAGNRAIAQLV
jgi:hypothetical protein